jgi:uncharacterized repeat protein (TIGR03803 family)
MTRQSCSFTNLIIAACVAMFALAGPTLADAQTESVIHSFRGTSVYDGVNPLSGLVADTNGALYGVAGGGKYGEGVVYKLVPPSTQGGAWTQNILYPFMGSLNGASDGSNPSGNIVFTDDFSHNGKIYGTTQGGGLYGGGTVYELSRPQTENSSWVETIIYNFGPGVEPVNGVTAGAEGRLYGTTLLGGRYNSGTVFVLSPPTQPGGIWTERTLYNFNGGSTVPQGYPTGLVLDASGSLYGATSLTSEHSGGVVFQLSPPPAGNGAWTESVLHVFTGEDGDGIEPSGSLVFDTAGSLYGVTLEGGQTGASGTVYELAPPETQGGSWTESVLHSFFPGYGDGGYPVAALALDSVGALYGVTQSGGIESCGDADDGCGTAFKLGPPATEGGPWTESFLYSFQGGSDGNYPQAPVIVVGTTVYGTTWLGGTGICNGGGGQLGCGTVFEITQ